MPSSSERRFFLSEENMSMLQLLHHVCKETNVLVCKNAVPAAFGVVID
jgi:hypothetical protein